MNRFVVLALSASMLLGACSDHKATTTAAAPELLPAQPAPPAVVAPPVALPPLPSVTAGDAAAAPVAALVRLLCSKQFRLLSDGSGSSIDSRPAEISAENLSSDVVMPFS